MTVRARVAAIAVTGALVGTALLSGCGASGAAGRPSRPGTSVATTVPVAATPSPAVTSSGSTAPARGTIPPLPNGPTGPAHPDPRPARPAAPPVSVSIPAIGVHSTLQALHVQSDGQLQEPSQWQRAGWYAGGTRPGDVGPAVIAGHVDSYEGPAVFYHLDELRPGDAVIVRRADGSSVRFVVAGARSYPKATFPTSAVYGPTAVPVLRLITCTGRFDESQLSYVDNLVVTAYLAR